MDIAAVKEAKDEELQALGLIHRGDILALRAFAQKGTNEDRVEKKRNLLQSLKEKFSGERLSKKRKSATLPAEKGHSSNSSRLNLHLEKSMRVGNTMIKNKNDMFQFV